MKRIVRGTAIALIGLSLGFAVVYYTHADCHPGCSGRADAEELERENAELREQLEGERAAREAEVNGVIDYRRAKRAAARELLEQLEEPREPDPT